MSQLPRPVYRLLYIAPHLVEERPCRSGIDVQQPTGELQIDRQGDQVLLRTVVQLALGPAAIGIGRKHEPFAGRAQLFDLTAQPVERIPQCLDVPSRQRGDLLVDEVRKLSVIARAASRVQAARVAKCHRQNARLRRSGLARAITQSHESSAPECRPPSLESR